MKELQVNSRSFMQHNLLWHVFWLYVCVCVCVRVRARACVRALVLYKQWPLIVTASSLHDRQP